MIYKTVRMVIFVAIICSACSTAPKLHEYQGGTHLVLHIEKTDNKKIDDDNQITISQILGKRLHDYGIKKFLIDLDNNHQIILKLPQSVKCDERLTNLITQPSKLEFKIVEDDYELDSEKTDNLPSNLEIIHSVENRYRKKKMYVVQKKSLLHGNHIKDAKVILNQFNQPIVTIDFNENGTKIFEKITAENIGNKLAIILDGKIYSAPIIHEKIPGGKTIISGAYSPDWAKNLAISLRNGFYPSKVTVFEKGVISQDER